MLGADNTAVSIYPLCSYFSATLNHLTKTNALHEKAEILPFLKTLPERFVLPPQSIEIHNNLKRILISSSEVTFFAEGAWRCQADTRMPSGWGEKM